jgi:acetyl-CoA carboxylase/biotin carboxylase 2/acetyl-CoA carboxylase/biotin carboxylase 1
MIELFTFSTESSNADPINVLTLTLRTNANDDDETLSTRYQQFIFARRQALIDRGIRRLTFIAAVERSFPKYYTFRARQMFEEDRIYR